MKMRKYNFELIDDGHPEDDKVMIFECGKADSLAQLQ